MRLKSSKAWHSNTSPSSRNGAVLWPPAYGVAMVDQLARRGTRGPGGPLPHLARIQAAFGPHDLSGVVAHGGSEARASARAMGALGFATNNHVAFAEPPSLHTAAHEAAHVIQQQAGVQLRTGVGEPGDRYERHADAVADRVVRGESATDLLGSPDSVGSRGSRADAGAVQMRLHRWPNPYVTNHDAQGILDALPEVQAAANHIDAAVEAGAADVRTHVADLLANQTTPQQIHNFFTPRAPSNTDNFVNKLIDWGNGNGNARALAIAAAGYIIEEYANAAAHANGIETQVILGGARPDFRWQTAHVHEQGNVEYRAHGLIDATSAAEAAKGHLPAKVLNMGEVNALNHPILYDCSYMDLGFGAVAPPVDLADPAVAARAGHHAELAEQGRARKASLRPPKP